ncbi:MAG: SH3 domain-containing protein, partial [Anaerolineae bacterium]|nr:SH3 domain-containing protein [Anaerolineae bacterium]
DRWITRVVFNHGGGDGSTLLAGISGTYTGNGLVFWDVAHPTEAYMGYFRQIHQIGLDSQPLAAVFSPDDCWMAVGTGSGVELWGIPADFIIPPTPTPTATFTPRPTSTPWPTPGPFELSQTPPYYTSTPTITLTPSLTPLPTATFTLSPTPLVLAIGGQARVQTVGGDTLSVRNVPGLDSDILARLEHGALVTLLDGPREVDGYVWWQLRTADGVEGWAVQAADDVQTLVPVG